MENNKKNINIILNTNNLNSSKKNINEISHLSQAYIFCKSLSDINNKNKNGWTPIFNSIISNNKQALIELIDLGANLNITNNLGETPLYSCVENENFELFKILLEKGADINIQKKNGETPLHLMIKKNLDKKYFFEIFKYNVNPNIPNKLYNQTATHLALKNKLKQDILVEFKKNKADIYNIKDKYDKNPFDYVKELNDNNYMELVIKIFDDKYLDDNNIIIKKKIEFAENSLI